MAKQYIYVQGKGSWFGNLGFLDQKYNKWNLLFYPNDESLNTLRELNLRNTISKDDEGWKIQLGRPGSKVFKGIVVAFEPPKVIDKEGKPLDANRIGNGSDCTVKLEHYTYAAPGSQKRLNAIRLESVRIDNLIPYEPKTDMSEADKALVEGLDKQPEQLF